MVRLAGAMIVTVGGPSTVRVAVAALPVPPLAEVGASVVLLFTPVLVPVTLTEKVQLPEATIDAPLRLTVELPPGAAIVPPPHEPVRPFGIETTTPAGSVSEKATAVSPTAFADGLVTVKVSWAACPAGIDAGANPIETTGGATTSIDAEAAGPAGASFETTPPVELTFVPPDTPVTLTEKVHDARAPSVAPERLMLVAPGAAVMVPPPQEPVTPGVVDMTSPAGSESVKCTPVSVSDEFGFAIVKLIDVADPTAIEVAPKDCWIVAVPTNTGAEEELPVPPLVAVTGAVVFV